MCRSTHNPDTERHRNERYRDWCYVCELLRDIIRPAESEPRKLADDQLARNVRIVLEWWMAESRSGKISALHVIIFKQTNLANTFGLT